ENIFSREDNIFKSILNQLKNIKVNDEYKGDEDEEEKKGLKENTDLQNIKGILNSLKSKISIEQGSINNIKDQLEGISKGCEKYDEDVYANIFGLIKDFSYNLETLKDTIKEVLKSIEEIEDDNDKIKHNLKRIENNIQVMNTNCTEGKQKMKEIIHKVKMMLAKTEQNDKKIVLKIMLMELKALALKIGEDSSIYKNICEKVPYPEDLSTKILSMQNILNKLKGLKESPNENKEGLVISKDIMKKIKNKTEDNKGIIEYITKEIENLKNIDIDKVDDFVTDLLVKIKEIEGKYSEADKSITSIGNEIRDLNEKSLMSNTGVLTGLIKNIEKFIKNVEENEITLNAMIDKVCETAMASKREERGYLGSIILQLRILEGLSNDDNYLVSLILGTNNKLDPDNGVINNLIRDLKKLEWKMNSKHPEKKEDLLPTIISEIKSLQEKYEADTSFLNKELNKIKEDPENKNEKISLCIRDIKYNLNFIYEKYSKILKILSKAFEDIQIVNETMSKDSPIITKLILKLRTANTKGDDNESDNAIIKNALDQLKTLIEIDNDNSDEYKEIETEIKEWKDKNFPQPPICYYTFKGHTDDIYGIVEMKENEIASCSKDNLILVWDIKECTCIRKLTQHRAGVHCLLYEPKDKLLYSGGADKTIIIWDFSSIKNDSIKCQDLMGHHNTITSLVLLSDGDLLSTSCDKSLIIWNLFKKEIRYKLFGHSGFIWGAIEVKEGNKFISCSSDKTLKIWEKKNKKMEFSTPAHNGEITAIYLLPDERIISAGVDKCIKIWEL
ncbi:MAG: hypothetical protein MJ252_11535, partial [archaeon]|nr:hypothetical protein [archaeon]